MLNSDTQKWIFIPGNVPSLKNNKDIIQIPIKGARACPVCKHRKGRPMLTASKRHKKYKKKTEWDWKSYRHEFHAMLTGYEKPFQVCIYFVRDSRRVFDFTNATDTVQDLMVEFGWLDDDNVTEMVPFFAGYRVNPARPGVYISVMKPIAVPIPEAEADLFQLKS